MALRCILDRCSHINYGYEKHNEFHSLPNVEGEGRGESKRSLLAQRPTRQKC
jgi:hypothetical protein